MNAAFATIAIVGATLIDPGSRTVTPNHTIVLEGDRVLSTQVVPKGARRIDARGLYLIPGLWDNHVHLTKAGSASLPLFVANGVTSVRDLGSDLAEVAAWRKEIQAGKRVGPRIRTSGQILESRANYERMLRDGGVEPYSRIRVPVGNPEEARSAVRKLAAAGADHIKMRTTPDYATFEAAVDEAHRHKLRFAAHAVAPPSGLLQTRLDSVEHFLAFPPAPFNANEIAGSGMFLSTTLVNIDGSIRVSYAKAAMRLQSDPLRKYVCGYLVKDWEEQLEEKKEDAYAEFEKYFSTAYGDLSDLHKAGVRFLAGTDVGVLFMYPGFSLHDELAILVRDVGLSSMDALRSATHNAAAFAGTPLASLADFALLEADPLVDIRNTRRIRAVVSRGRFYDRKQLDAMLKQVESSCRVSSKR